MNVIRVSCVEQAAELAFLEQVSSLFRTSTAAPRQVLRHDLLGYLHTLLGGHCRDDGNIKEVVPLAVTRHDRGDVICFRHQNHVGVWGVGSGASTRLWAGFPPEMTSLASVLFVLGRCLLSRFLALRIT